MQEILTQQWHYDTAYKLRLFVLHVGSAARYVNYGFKETVTWDPLLAGPPWRQRKIHAHVSDDIPAACIRKLRVMSIVF
jgi:hypothetical protein